LSNEEQREKDFFWMSAQKGQKAQEFKFLSPPRKRKIGVGQIQEASSLLTYTGEFGPLRSGGREVWRSGAISPCMWGKKVVAQI